MIGLLLEFLRIVEEKILNRTKKHLNQNLEMLLKWGKDVPELKISRPDAAAIIFAKINTSTSCEKLIFELGIIIVCC